MRNLKIIFLIVVLGVFSAFSSVGQKRMTGYPMENGKAWKHVSYSPNGKYLGVATTEGLFVYFNGTPSPKKKINNTGHKEVLDLAFTPDEQFAVTTGESGEIKVWSLEDNESFSLKGHLKEVRDISISENGQYIASASEDRMVKLWSIEEKKEINTFFTHRAEIFAVAFSHNGKFLASAGKDKSIIIRELPLGVVVDKLTIDENPVHLQFTPKDDFLVIGGDKGKVMIKGLEDGSLKILPNTPKSEMIDMSVSPDGKFISSLYKNSQIIIFNTELGIKQIEDQLSGKVYGLDFDPKGKSIAVTGKNNILDVTSLNITPKLLFKDASDNTPPLIKINSPSIPGDRLTVTDPTLDLAGLVMDDHGIHSVIVNGQETYLTSDGDFKQEIGLTMGENLIRIEAKDINNNKAIKELNIVRQEKGNDEYFFDVDPENYLLVIGVDKYQDWPMLSNAVSDANAVKDVLLERYGFNEENVIQIFNEEVTRQGIMNSFKEVVAKVKPSDNLMIYYSGHGHYDATFNEGYWVPVDASKGSEAEYFSNSDLLKIIKRVDSKHTFLVVDACFSGSLFNQSSRGFIDNVANIKSRWGLTSGRLEFVSDGNAGDRSPFCKNLLEFLETNEKSRFPVSELVQFVKVNVANETDQTPIGNPLKSVGDEGGEFIFKLE